MRIAIRTACLLGLIAAAAQPASSRRSRLPARIDDTVDVYHGVAVHDPYRWLEDAGSDETIRWLRGQEELLEDYVAGVRVRGATRRRVLELSGDGPFLAP